MINSYGDGNLSIFDSAVQAVNCGIELQKKFNESPAIPVRIGINSGDIVITEVGVIGDSVNLASRVASIGIAGSVILSAKIAEDLRNHESIKLVSLGFFHFKNDSEPKEVFAIQDKHLVIPEPSQIDAKLEKSVLNTFQEHVSDKKGITTRGYWITGALVILALVLSWLDYNRYHFYMMKEWIRMEAIPPLTV